MLKEYQVENNGQIEWMTKKDMVKLDTVGVYQGMISISCIGIIHDIDDKAVIIDDQTSKIYIRKLNYLSNDRVSFKLFNQSFYMDEFLRV